MAQSVKCLLPKHEGLSSNPQHLCKNWAQKHRSVIPGLGSYRDKGIFAVCWPTNLAQLVSSRFIEALSQKRWKIIKEDSCC